MQKSLIMRTGSARQTSTGINKEKLKALFKFCQFIYKTDINKYTLFQEDR